MKMLKVLSCIAVLAASAVFVGCAASTEPSYENPSQLDQQTNLQELHGDILRQNY